MTQKLKSALQGFTDSLHTYDYILFAAFGALYLLILLLAIVLRKRAGLSLSLVLIAFVVIIAGPVWGYTYTHGKLYKTEISEQAVKKLEFSEALIITGKLKNLGMQSYSRCVLTASAHKAPTNFLEEIVLPLKPFQNVSYFHEKVFPVNETYDFKLVMEPFTYSDEFNISIKADCL